MFSEGKVAAIAPGDRTPGQSAYSAVYGHAGCDSCSAHSVRVDPEHNIWMVDATGQVIYKTDQQMRVVMQLGQKGVAGTGHNNFNLPTDVGFAPNGDFYVTDGYAGSRVVKFSREGIPAGMGHERNRSRPVRAAPQRSGRFAGQGYVTNRENRRIEVFDSNGRFFTEWPTIEGVSGLFITKDQQIWAGGVLLNLKGEIVGKLPKASAAGGHAVVANDSGDVYLAQLNGSVQKLVKQPAP